MNVSAKLALAALSVSSGVAGGAATLSWGCDGSLPAMAGSMAYTEYCIATAPMSAYYGFMVAMSGLAIGIGIMRLGGGQETDVRFERPVWSTRRDARRAHLLLRPKDDESRIRIVGKIKPEYFWQTSQFMTYCGDAPMLVSGANRSGKGRGILVPTLLSYAQSAFIVDPKGEFFFGDPRVKFLGTSGWRATFSKVVYFCLTDRRSARYNFLRACRSGDEEVRDVQNLVISTIKAANPTFWDKTSQEYVIAICLHLRNGGGGPNADVSLAGVRKFLGRGDDGAREIILENVHPIAHQNASLLFPAGPFGEEGDKMVAQRSDVYRTAASYLWLFDDPVVAEVTSGKCDFQLGDLMCLDRPMSLYVRNPPSDADRCAKLTHLLISQMFRELAEFTDTDIRGRKKNFRCLVNIDEFAGLGHMPDFEQKLPQIPGFGFDIVLAVQTLSQIDKLYGEKNDIIDNCHVLVTFAANEPKTLKRISDMVGMAPEIRGTKTKSRNRQGTSVSTGESRSWTSVLHPGDVRTLPENEQLVMLLGHLPWRVNKIQYDKEPSLSARVMPPLMETPKAVNEPVIPVVANTVLRPAKFWKEERS